MKQLLAVLVFAGVSVRAESLLETFGSGANQFQIEFVTIGNPANSADTSGFPNQVGRVDYTYNLGKYEISRNMIQKANLQGGLGISLADMSRFGANGADRPATGFSWNAAARFVNWLNISKGYQAAYNFTTSGINDNLSLWSDGQYSGSNKYRHKDAFYFLPSRDEWYKGAYGSPSGDWYNFQTGSDSSPMPVSGGTDANTAVYDLDFNQGPADVTNAGGLSPYGTMAQGGNVWEFNESAFDGTNNSPSENREVRGGGWYYQLSGFDLEPTVSGGGSPTIVGGDGIGFRVAMIPEPSSLSLLLAGGAVLMAGKRSRLPKKP